MTAADPMAAVAAYLLTIPAVTSLVAGRIYRPDLNSDEDIAMPTSAIVIRRAGGYQLFGGLYVPVGDPRLDIYSYGETYLDADGVAAEVVNALKALRGGVYAGTRLMWARIEGGPMPLSDPEDNWPMVVVTAQVAHCELAVA